MRLYCIYPKTPEFHIDDTFQAIQRVYDQLVSEVGHQNVVVMGDGSGGALALSCTISFRQSTAITE